MKIIILLLITIFNSILAIATPIVNCQSDSAVYNAKQKVLKIPNVKVDNQVFYSAELSVLNNQNTFHFQLSTLSQPEKTIATSSYQASNQLLTLDKLCLFNGDNSHSNFTAQLQAVPHSQPLQFLLKTAKDSNGVTIYNWLLADNKGALLLTDRQGFEKLASTSNTSGINGVREIKFVMLDLDTNNPVLYFMNSVATTLHYDFVRDVLKRYQNLSYSDGGGQFTAESYFRDDRRHLTGSVVAYDNYQVTGLYALEFWPTDSVPAHIIERAYKTVSAAMPFLPTPIAYHPVGTNQELELQGFAEQLVAKNIRTITTDRLFEQLDKATLNNGEAYGRLKIISPSDPNPSEDIIAIYTFIPNTLGHVGGIITEQPQTPLSHINLKARQNNTPNAYIKNARVDPNISPLIDHWVHYVVSENGIQIEAATEEESLKWLADKIPAEVTIPESDLTLLAAKPLSQLGFDDWLRVGVKAANVAELGKILTEGVAPKGYTLPFSMYDTFMQLKRCINDMTKLCTKADSVSFYQHVENLLAQEAFNKDQQARAQSLKQLRKAIEQAEVPQSLIDQVEAVRLFWEPAGASFKQKLRVRSSTNNEDLKGFNGAGLYDSFTHKPEEGKLINSVKQVWASLWNQRAFDERRLHRIDHLKTYMGVLIHASYGDEQANGVAITKNIYNPTWEGYYVNAQYGELSITNPEPISTDQGLINSRPDEFIITHIPGSASELTWETLFIRHSNIETVYNSPVSTENVLKASEMDELRVNLQQVQSHFKNLYQGDDDFAMDIEFKITATDDGSRGQLAIKQARPWID